ncbi:unnamed protein product [Vitrella brassicaformis CCMP3155]|uniref:Casein kinase I n=2 Tax=Vitrella brassicaformis TaxID=1169539 RepID=A0A0G4G5B1_VITBC|nr:unnamed protein product [Vitrella brassicaformis CCMP3155]|eukprot:CEM23755.1 unnamed protein product [Vitrella brassicaformis CCMP3155]
MHRVGPHQRFMVLEVIGSGSFSTVYRGFDTVTKDEVAIKMEPKSIKIPLLAHESRVYRNLATSDAPIAAVPRVYWYGEEGEYSVLVLERLGPSLDHLLMHLTMRQGRQAMSLKTVLMIADQVLEALRCVHRNGYVYRDIKPENCLIGMRGQAHRVYIVDYGLAKRYVDVCRMGQHVPMREGKKLVGTAIFASLNNHMGRECSRRDDVESLGFMLTYLAMGKLPWMDVAVDDRLELYDAIKRGKIECGITHLCASLPDEFAAWFHHCRALSFAQQPDYAYLKQLILRCFIRHQLHFDRLYDWSRALSPQQRPFSMSLCDVEHRGFDWTTPPPPTPAAAAASASSPHTTTATEDTNNQPHKRPRPLPAPPSQILPTTPSPQAAVAMDGGESPPDCGWGGGLTWG